MIKKISGVIVGYAVFVISSILLFQLSGKNPHQEVEIGFKIITLIYGAVFSIISGFVVQLIAKSKNLKLNYILAFIIAGFATFSLIKASGSHWTQLFAIFIFTPISILGGFLYLKKQLGGNKI
jgi:ABC-type Fe3+-siderophore transport system permease subunit